MKVTLVGNADDVNFKHDFSIAHKIDLAVL